MLATGVAAVALLAVTTGSTGFVERHAAVYDGAPATLSWVEDDEQARGARHVRMWPATNAMFAGDRLEREVSLLSPSDACDDVRRRLATELLVLGPGVAALPGALRGCLLGVGPIYADESGTVFGPR